MHAARPLVAAGVMLLATSTCTRAQDRVREWWGVLGAGAGSANIACDICTSGWKRAGPTLLATVGEMLTPHFGVGFSLDQWWGSPTDTEATSLGTVAVHYYPIRRAGAFFEAGVGYSRAEVALDRNRTARAGGVGLMAAAGYDVRVVRSTDHDITLTPRVSYVFSPLGDLRYAAGSPPFATGWRHQVLSAGLGVGFVFYRAHPFN